MLIIVFLKHIGEKLPTLSRLMHGFLLTCSYIAARTLISPSAPVMQLRLYML